MSSEEENIFMARVAEQAERFEDMVDFLKPVLDSKGTGLSTDERNLLSVAFKSLISSKRTAWRTISAIEQNPKYQKFSGSLAAYKQKIENALYADCEKIIDIVRTKVLSKASGQDEPRAFFVKMVGDYYRYIAETAQGDKLEQVKTEALKAYNEAQKIPLPPCNPIKLGLALNFSVFHYEVMKDQKQACQLAEESLQLALDKIDEISEEDFRDAKSIIELLKENLALWKDEDGGNNVDDL
jgi:14-3-3 protein epsilon